MSLAAAILVNLALLSASADQERLRLEYDDLAARAEALIQVADQMQANLEQQDQTLHPDMVTTRNRLEEAMDRAGAALDRGDWKALSRHLARARGWIAVLQRKL